MIHTLSEKIKFITDVFGSGRLWRNSPNFDVRCPICAPRDPSKKKLSIHLETDMLHCWVCGFKAFTLAPLIRRFGSQSQMAEYLEKFMPDAAKRSRFLSSSIDKIPEKLRLPKGFKLLITSPGYDPDIAAIKSYCYARGLTDKDFWYFKLGYSNELRWRRRVIVPSFDAVGEINHFVARTIDKRIKPKYDMPDVERMHVIFNELNIDWTRQVVLCEGAFDAFKCGDNAIALLGSDLNEQSALFSSIIANGSRVALALDGDMWDRKTPKIARKLAEYNVDVSIVDTRPFNDPGAASCEQFQEALELAKPFSWQDTFMSRLSIASRTSLRL